MSINAEEFNTAEKRDSILGAIIEEKAISRLIEAVKINTNITRDINKKLLDLVVKIDNLSSEVQKTNYMTKKLDKKVNKMHHCSIEQQNFIKWLYDKNKKKREFWDRFKLGFVRVFMG